MVVKAEHAHAYGEQLARCNSMLAIHDCIAPVSAPEYLICLLLAELGTLKTSLLSHQS